MKIPSDQKIKISDKDSVVSDDIGLNVGNDFDICEKLNEEDKKLVAEGVKRTLEEYGEVLKRLGDN